MSTFEMFFKKPCLLPFMYSKLMLDKWAYILFSINLVNGALVLFYFPLVYEIEEYSIILVHLFGLQFASLFEAGSILFFTNLVAGKALSESYAYSK